MITGETWQLDFTVKSRTTGELVDPATISIEVTDPAGDKTTATLTEADEGLTLTKTGAGKYRAEVDLTDDELWVLLVKTEGPKGRRRFRQRVEPA